MKGSSVALPTDDDGDGKSAPTTWSAEHGARNSLDDEFLSSLYCLGFLVHTGSLFFKKFSVGQERAVDRKNATAKEGKTTGGLPETMIITDL